MTKIHSFHVPVMGTGFSIDTPIKVGPYGIDSVISLVDDELIEEMRAFYSRAYGEPYTAITKNDDDHRARRITSYLDLVNKIVDHRFHLVQTSAFEPGSEITKYFELLSDSSPLKKQYNQMLASTNPEFKLQMQDKLRAQMKPGSIDVNIMTKLDRMNYDKSGQELAQEYSDALSALRGYAQSKLTSAIVFSAGINRRLYSYIEKFEDFFANKSGEIKKRIILKVSDYRSSLIQGQFLAKKGIWVSEFRVESGLNCGGHAFASDGFLMGPILDEFRKKRTELITNLHEVYSNALKLKERLPFATPHAVRITAQGGIGTHNEDKFLREHYELDATGWATPFLLVPEVTNVDPNTLQQLANAGENDVYLSDSSPLGVPFNNLRVSASETERERKIAANRPGSACPKSYLVSNTEFTEKPICTASRQYQKLKLDQIKSLALSPAEYNQKFSEVVQKSCICHDLGESPRILNNIFRVGMGRFTAVCPGPNIAYFSKVSTLSEMVSHIYGRINLLNDTYRPNMFIKELKLYVDYFVKEVQKASNQPTNKQIQYFNEFKSNLFDGIEYYKQLFPQMVDESNDYRERCLKELTEFKGKLDTFIADHAAIFSPPQPQLVNA